MITVYTYIQHEADSQKEIMSYDLMDIEIGNIVRNISSVLKVMACNIHV